MKFQPREENQRSATSLAEAMQSTAQAKLNSKMEAELYLQDAQRECGHERAGEGDEEESIENKN